MAGSKTIKVRNNNEILLSGNMVRPMFANASSGAENLSYGDGAKVALTKALGHNIHDLESLTYCVSSLRDYLKTIDSELRDKEEVLEVHFSDGNEAICTGDYLRPIFNNGSKSYNLNESDKIKLVVAVCASFKSASHLNSVLFHYEKQLETAMMLDAH